MSSVNEVYAEPQLLQIATLNVPQVNQLVLEVRSHLLEALWDTDARLALPVRRDHKLGIGCQVGTAEKEEVHKIVID